MSTTQKLLIGVGVQRGEREREVAFFFLLFKHLCPLQAIIIPIFQIRDGIEGIFGCLPRKGAVSPNAPFSIVRKNGLSQKHCTDKF